MLPPSSKTRTIPSVETSAPAQKEAKARTDRSLVGLLGEKPVEASAGKGDERRKPEESPCRAFGSIEAAVSGMEDGVTCVLEAAHAEKKECGDDCELSEHARGVAKTARLTSEDVGDAESDKDGLFRANLAADEAFCAGDHVRGPQNQYSNALFRGMSFDQNSIADIHLSTPFSSMPRKTTQVAPGETSVIMTTT